VKFFLAIFIFLFIICVFLLPKITLEEEATGGKDSEIFIQTNGVHADIVVPVKSEFKHWEIDFPYSNTKSKDSRLNYLAIGWGDKGFYLETPSLDDLKASIALKASIGIRGSAIYATFYPSIKLSPTFKSIKLSGEQYHRLIQFIEKSLVKNTEGENPYIPPKDLYSVHAAFYEAYGRYNVFYSCIA